MATYRIKPVNHTQATDRVRGAIKSNLQDLFNQAFASVSDSAAVDWGSGAASDSVVIHVVNDIESSYLSRRCRAATSAATRADIRATDPKRAIVVRSSAISRGGRVASRSPFLVGAAAALTLVLGCPKQSPLEPKSPADGAKNNDSDDRVDPRDLCPPKSPDGAAWDENDGCPGAGAGGSPLAPSR